MECNWLWSRYDGLLQTTSKAKFDKRNIIPLIWWDGKVMFLRSQIIDLAGLRWNTLNKPVIQKGLGLMNCNEQCSITKMQNHKYLWRRIKKDCSLNERAFLPDLALRWGGKSKSNWVTWLEEGNHTVFLRINDMLRQSLSAWTFVNIRTSVWVRFVFTARCC